MHRKVSSIAEQFVLLTNCVLTSHESQYVHAGFAEAQLTQDERVWLQNKCDYFKPEYLDYLQSYRFKPDQVMICTLWLDSSRTHSTQILVNFTPSSDNPAMGNVEIEARGLWLETILWEVPLMACLSEIYFQYADQDWDYAGQEGGFSSLFTPLSMYCVQNKPCIRLRVFSTHAVHSVILGRVVEGPSSRMALS
jgi:nicotinic acid phosphoribosyltransferase